MANKTVVFLCQYPNLVMDIVSPSSKVENGRTVYDPGKSVRFSDGILQTDDAGVIKHIKKHVWFGTAIIEKPEKAGENQEGEAGDE